MASRISIGVYERVFSIAYLVVGTSVAFTLTSIPFFAVLYLFEPQKMWVIVALTALTLFPSLSAAFGVFTDFTDSGERAILSCYFHHWRRSWTRGTIVGAFVVTLITVLAVDFAYLWINQVGAILAPILLMGIAVTLAVGVGALAVDQLAPGHSLRVLLKATFYITLRRFYITALSWLVLAAASVIIVMYPAIGLGIVVSPALFLFWSHTRYCMRAVISPSVTTPMTVA